MFETVKTQDLAERLKHRRIAERDRFEVERVALIMKHHGFDSAFPLVLTEYASGGCWIDAQDNLRLEAALQAGLETVPVRRVRHAVRIHVNPRYGHRALQQGFKGVRFVTMGVPGIVEIRRAFLKAVHPDKFDVSWMTAVQRDNWHLMMNSFVKVLTSAVSLYRRVAEWDTAGLVKQGYVPVDSPVPEAVGNPPDGDIGFDDCFVFEDTEVTSEDDDAIVTALLAYEKVRYQGAVCGFRREDKDIAKACGVSEALVSEVRHSLASEVFDVANPLGLADEARSNIEWHIRDGKCCEDEGCALRRGLREVEALREKHLVFRMSPKSLEYTQNAGTQDLDMLFEQLSEEAAACLVQGFRQAVSSSDAAKSKTRGVAVNWGRSIQAFRNVLDALIGFSLERKGGSGV